MRLPVSRCLSSPSILLESQPADDGHSASVPPTSTSSSPRYEFWTTDETAAYLRCAPQTIRKALSQQGSYHGLKPRRFGRRWYFAAADVRSMLEVA